ncbi:sensor histidine kinase [Rheinheimera sp. UJ63]|uniref:sensor histidine kinase n=1 Tax=Rheinheimera sp. UJ63 TaxID=2910157 RepID=UPI001F1FEDE2|nr:histidine kinase [Rheinheimera sp. UJ63]MCF4008867.1 histidine kinase [Rheinheimera sp. UJ63]
MLQRFYAYLQVDRPFLLGIFCFSYFLVISNRVRAGMVSWYTFTPEAPIVTFCSALLIFLLVRYCLNRFQHTDDGQLSWLKMLQIICVSLLVYLAFNNSISLLISVMFNTVERNFSPNLLLSKNLGDIVDVVLFAGIYLARYHWQAASRYQQQVADYNQQLAQLTIQQLKAQLNPHFIFNALNTLDELINVDQKQASRYLHDFAALYRLSMHNATQQLVPLAQEIEFAEYYFKLMQTRVGPGYQLAIDPALRSNQSLLPPFSLQLLLENVFLHNHGSLAAPLLVDISLQQQRVVVSNPLQPSAKKTRSGNGIGLTNLAKQFLFLTGRNLDISQANQRFSVSLPLVEEQPSV